MKDQIIRQIANHIATEYKKHGIKTTPEYWSRVAAEKIYNLEFNKKIIDALKLQEATHKKICEWFENEYESGTDEDVVKEWEGKAIGVAANIKMLRHLLLD